MSSQALQQLRVRSGVSGGAWFLKGLGAISALLLPLMVLTAGMALALLIDYRGSAKVGVLQLGPWIKFDPSWLSESITPLQLMILLIAKALVLGAVQALLLWWYYRQIQFHAVDVVVSAYEMLRKKNSEMAMAQSVSGQKEMLSEALMSQLPKVKNGLLWWGRSWPRHIVQVIACMGLALAIHPLLTLLTGICALLIGQLYSWADRRQRTKSPVLKERVTHHGKRLAELCEIGPLLESVHPNPQGDSGFRDELIEYRKAAYQYAIGSSWKTPLLIVATSFVVALLAAILSVQIVDPGKAFSVAAAIALCGAEIGAAAGYLRFIKARQHLPVANAAAAEILKYLDIPVPSVSSPVTKKLAGIRQRVLLEHVTLQDSSGNKLLEDIGLSASPGQVISIVSTGRLESRALAELILGFGRPVSGRMMYDDILVSDLDPRSLSEHALWISADGPLYTGTIEENLRGDRERLTLADLTDAIRATGAFDGIQNLVDGLNTLVTPHDDRLAADQLFRLGLARALLRKASLVIAEEPAISVESSVEQATTAAIRRVANQKSIVILLPNRLHSLRDSDAVVLLHEHRVVAAGKHADLLQQSELYRHINYIRFSPFRHLGS